MEEPPWVKESKVVFKRFAENLRSLTARGARLRFGADGRSFGDSAAGQGGEVALARTRRRQTRRGV
jgi:hypothetical protein